MATPLQLTKVQATRSVAKALTIVVLLLATFVVLYFAS